MTLPPLPLTTPGVNPSQIHLSSRPLGRGSFGSVWRGTYSGSAVAIKVCNLTDHPTPQSLSAAVQFRRESTRYAALRHPCITQFFCVVSHPTTNRLLLVTELMRGGSLYDALAKFRRAGVRRIATEGSLRIASQITNGLAYLHASSFSFGDLKSMNVLLSEEVDIPNASFPPTLQAKLCDFGLSRNLKHLVDAKSDPRPDETPIPGRKGPAGTFAYMAPEAFGGLPVNDADAPKRADIFALGVVLWELATLRCPWPGKQPMQLIPLVREQGNRPDWTAEELRDLPTEYVQLVQHCWHQDALQRPTVDEVAHRLECINATLAPHAHLKYNRVRPQCSNTTDRAVRDGCRTDIVMHMDGGSADWEQASEELLEVVHVEEEELDEGTFALVKNKVYFANAATSYGVSAQHSQFSDVTGESHRTGNNSTASVGVEPRVVCAGDDYLETDDTTEPIIDYESARSTSQGDLEQELAKVKINYTGKASQYDWNMSYERYIEKREWSKMAMLSKELDDERSQPRESYGETIVGDIGAKQLIWSPPSVASEGKLSHVEKRERTRSYLLPKRFTQPDEEVEDELRLYCEDSVPPRQSATYDVSVEHELQLYCEDEVPTRQSASCDAEIYTDAGVSETNLPGILNDNGGNSVCEGMVRGVEEEESSDYDSGDDSDADEEEVVAKEGWGQKTEGSELLIAQVQTKKSYTLPGEDWIDDELMQELSILDEEEALDFGSTGVNMYSRPHFR